jgi:hypothetical protein
MIARLLALLFAACVASTAQAAGFWSAPGSSCVPDHNTTKNNRALFGNPSVRHAATAVDPIVLTCGIQGFESAASNWNLALTYQDSTGTAASAFVRARLFRMGVGSATPVAMPTVTSNSSSVTTLNSVSSPFTHTFDFNNNVYWVRVELDRNATSQIVIFHSVALVPPISDISAKHDIVLLGHLDNGLGFYRFSYNGSDTAYVGVMAQEVQTIMPDAVMRGSDGYLRVYYDRLGFHMQTWEEWVASGEKIPATAPSVQQ